MASKIDVTEIVVAHLKSIKRYGAKRPAVSDWIVFAILPLSLATILLYYKVYLSESLVSTLIGAFSIFVGLLLNVIVVLFDIIRSTTERKIKIDLLEETLANIAFAIVLALFTIVLSFLTQIKRWDWVSPTANFITYALLALFISTLLMIINRMYYLFYDEFEVMKRKHINKDSSDN